MTSYITPFGDHRDGRLALTGALGLTQGVNFDTADASQLPSVNFSDYSAIVVASDYGGILTAAEIDALIARKTEIASFVNGGGGIAAFAECGPTFPNCEGDLVTASTNLFGFLPINASSVATTAPYTVTAFGSSLGLTNADVDDCCTHNSFADAAGLKVVDFDQNGIPTTLAGDVKITEGGFTGVPEPGIWALMIAGFALAGVALRRRGAAAVAWGLTPPDRR